MRNENDERAELAQETSKRPSASGQLREAVREAAIAYTRRRVALGVSQAAIARELGVTTMTTARWLSAVANSPKSRARRRVKKMRALRAVETPAVIGGTIVATTRDGLRIEGIRLAISSRSFAASDDLRNESCGARLRVPRGRRSSEGIRRPLRSREARARGSALP
jgi:transcriptional regulator with XRE-family HTH domain